MRTRRVVATLLACGVVATACNSQPDDGALVLPDGDVTAAPATEEPEPAETDEPTEPPDTDDDPEQLYPPLPPGETDPELAVPVEHQEIVLEVHEELYRLTQTAFSTGEFDPEELATVLHGDLLSAVLTEFEQRRDAGIVSVSPDTGIEYVRVVGGGNGPVVIHECRIAGPGTVDVDSNGNQVSEANRTEPVALLFEVTYEIIDIVDGELEFRAVRNDLIEAAGACDA